MRPAVFLDRDGVLNRATVRRGRPYPPKDLSELQILPGVAGALRRLREAGFALVVVTNQPDVARGSATRDSVEAINDQLAAQLPIDGFFTCYHDDAENCACRKPKPGLLFQGRDTLGLDMSRSFMVGDRWRDIEAGRQAGCRTALIDYHYDERRPEPGSLDFACSSLEEAAGWILSLSERKESTCRSNS